MNPYTGHAHARPPEDWIALALFLRHPRRKSQITAFLGVYSKSIVYYLRTMRRLGYTIDHTPKGYQVTRWTPPA